MGLAAVVDLVLEEVGEERVDALGDHAVVAAVDADAAVEVGGGEAVAEGDEAAVGGGLGGAERGGLGEVGVGGLEDGEAAAGLLERVEIVDVDGVEVVERAAERGEEAGARGGEGGGVEALAGLEQAVVGPGVVAGHGAEVGRGGHRAVGVMPR